MANKEFSPPEGWKMLAGPNGVVAIDPKPRRDVLQSLERAAAQLPMSKRARARVVRLFEEAAQKPLTMIWIFAAVVA